MKRQILSFMGALALSSSCLMADTMAWEVTGNNQFGTANLTTGTFTSLSSLGFNPAGLGEVNGSVYTAIEGGTSLYSIDKTGHQTLVGMNSNISYYAFGSTNSGLYMVDTVGGLWNINPANGAATLIGSTHLNMSSSSYFGMSSGSNILYIALGSNVYTINTSTGGASYIGNSGTTDFGALVDVSGTVYGTTTIAPLSVYSFNPASGTSAFLTNTVGPDYAFGLAPIVPEPASFALFGIGAALLGGFAVKRRKA